MEKEIKLFIKGMVCNRCVMVVNHTLTSLGYMPSDVRLGAVTLPADANSPDQSLLEKQLAALGFDILEDPQTVLARKCKALVQEVYSGDFDFPVPFRFSALAKERLQTDYDRISDAFVAVEKKTIEQYLIGYRIDKVKEYLVYSNYTLADIAFRLNFTSVGHLSAQFKQQTGLTPSFFKTVKKEKSERIFSMN